MIEEDLKYAYNEDSILFYQGEKPLTYPHVVINRSRNYILGKQLELAGINVCNSSFVTLMGNDKILCGQYVAGLGVPIMPTYNEKFIPKSMPYILKACNGHGGTEVFKIECKEQHESAIQALQCKKLLMQKLASDMSKDLRVYVIGIRVVQALLRTS